MSWQPPTYSDEALDTPAAEPSDSELITAVRGGDESAFASLWTRHELAAHRLARQIANPSNADDLVSEAFLRVLRALKSGSGPDGAFRPYLFSTLRRINIDTGRSYYTRVALTDDERELDLDHSESAADVMADQDEGSAAWRAWNSLPDSSKTLLWHLLIEEETPAQIAPLLGTTPNGVSSRAVRAKERLRQAFLQQHLLDADNIDCRRARSRMGEYVRNALSARDRSEVHNHLEDCAGCKAALFEISDLNQTMRVLIAPIVLGGVAVAGNYVASGAVAAGTKGSLFGHAMTKGLKNPAVATATVVTVVAVGIGIAFGVAALTKDEPRKAVAAVPTPSVAPSPSSPAPTSVPAISSSPSSVVPTQTPLHTITPTKANPVVATPPAPAPSTTHRVSVRPPTTPTPSPTVPTLSLTTMNVLVLRTDAAPSGATVDFEPTGGWMITKITGPTSMVCDPLPAPTTHCTISGPVPAGEQDFSITLRAPSTPAPSGDTMPWTYTDENATLSQAPTIPGDR